eukprot:3818944-Prorocentrum_lima.AAC.1
MIALTGMFFQDRPACSTWGNWALPTASLLRAFETELVVQDTASSFDPAGFYVEGKENFKHQRQTEVKHGCLSMRAVMGFI